MGQFTPGLLSWASVVIHKTPEYPEIGKPLFAGIQELVSLMVCTQA